MLEKQARVEFGKFVRTPKGRPAWALLIESIETGLYGPPTRADSTRSITVRVLLPWLPQRSFAGFHLKNPLTHSQHALGQHRDQRGACLSGHRHRERSFM